MSEPETVDHPLHYGGKTDPYEAIKVIESWALGFHLGNTVKYICRAGSKGDELEDLKKAAWYLTRYVAHLQGYYPEEDPEDARPHPKHPDLALDDLMRSIGYYNNAADPTTLRTAIVRLLLKEGVFRGIFNVENVE